MLKLQTIAPGFVCLLIAAGFLPAQIITTIAGGGPFVGGVATQTTIEEPSSLRCSGAVCYIASAIRHEIYKVDAGIVSRIAGNGSGGFSGDGGPALDAQLYWPSVGAVDALGNLYFADSGNHRIRKIDTAGIITTVAGTGVSGLSGDG